MVVHHLYRVRQLPPVDAGAQRRGTVGHLLPGARERLRVGRSGQPYRGPVEVRARVVDEAVEAPGLQGCQGQDVRHLPAVAHQPVQMFLGQVGEREVGGGAAAGVRPGAVVHDVAQRRAGLLGEAADGGLVVHGGRVGQTEFEPAVLDDAGEVQEVGAGFVGVGVAPGRRERGAVQTSTRTRTRTCAAAAAGAAAAATATTGARVPLAVVVESDLRSRGTGERAVREQSAQGAVTDPRCGTARSCSLTERRVSRHPASGSTVRASGYSAVNQPMVRDRSTSPTASTGPSGAPVPSGPPVPSKRSSRPCPSTPMSTVSWAHQRPSVRAKALSSTSLTWVR
ncbi:hypothetical protein SMD44_08950 [Streptomyces alboflavus]|uniref:Uncharacterized protein n=1 Tax=Streptomyces alboflavus TaxID=67267 RepID=A0A1Z1WSP5_9ACTN|nr:hypothetical protein SMD44_08950 [Streptomyces alboflavus]